MQLNDFVDVIKRNIIDMAVIYNNINGAKPLFNSDIEHSPIKKSES